jgi:hypothetical protein
LGISGSVCRDVRLRERSCAQRSLSSVKHGGSLSSDYLPCLKRSMSFACVQGGIRCSRKPSWLNSKVSADVTARLLSSAEPFHTQVDHRLFNSSTHDSYRSSHSFRGYFVCRASLSWMSRISLSWMSPILTVTDLDRTPLGRPVVELPHRCFARVAQQQSPPHRKWKSREIAPTVDEVVARSHGP